MKRFHVFQEGKFFFFQWRGEAKSKPYATEDEAYNAGLIDYEDEDWLEGDDNETSHLKLA